MLIKIKRILVLTYFFSPIPAKLLCFTMFQISNQDSCDDWTFLFALISLFFAVILNAPRVFCFAILPASFSFSATCLASLSDYALALIRLSLISPALGSPNPSTFPFHVRIPFLFSPVWSSLLNGFEFGFVSFSFIYLSRQMFAYSMYLSCSLILSSFSRIIYF